MYEHTTLADAERHDVADIIRLGDDLRFYIRLFNAFRAAGVRQQGRVVHIYNFIFSGVCNKAHVGHGRYYRLVKLPLQALLYDLHVQQAEEPAAKAETQCLRSFQLVCKRCIIQLQLFHAVPQLFKFFCFYREDARKNHRLHIFKTVYAAGGGVGHIRKRIAHFHLFGIFNTGNDVAHIAAFHFIFFLHAQLQYAHFIGIVFLICAEEFYLLPFFEAAVKYAVVNDDTAKTVEHTVKYQCLQRCIRVTFGCGNAGNDGS